MLRAVVSHNPDCLTKGSSLYVYMPELMKFFLPCKSAILGASLTETCKNVPISVAMSVRPSVTRNNQIAAERILMKSNIGEFNEICRHIPVFVKIGQQYRTLYTKTYMPCYSTRVTLGNPQPGNTVMKSSPIRISEKRSLAWDNSDINGAIRKCQRSCLDGTTSCTPNYLRYL